MYVLEELQWRCVGSRPQCVRSQVSAGAGQHCSSQQQIVILSGRAEETLHWTRGRRVCCAHQLGEEGQNRGEEVRVADDDQGGGAPQGAGVPSGPHTVLHCLTRGQYSTFGTQSNCEELRCAAHAGL